MKNKKGWIRIVEAFIAILLVTGVLLTIVNKGYLGKSEISARIYDAEVSILREVELNDDFRKEVLSVQEGDLPLAWKDFETKGVTKVKQRIIERIPAYLECEARICKLAKVIDGKIETEICGLGEYKDVEIYAQAVAITATLETYDPRQLKLFCWVG